MVAKKLTGAVLSVERAGDEPRNITLSLTCPHGSTVRRISTKRNKRLGEAFFKIGVALGHEAKFKCDCELTQAPDVKTKRTRKKKEPAVEAS